MISWIIALVLIIWVLIKRFSADGYIKGEPLGMPRGTVRAFITILIVAFPFGYFIFDIQIEGIIISSIFILVAFYSQSRKEGNDKIKKILQEIQEPESFKEKQKYPLYLPKYSVRLSLILMIGILLVLNALSSKYVLESSDTLVNLLVILCFFFVGIFFRKIDMTLEKRKIQKFIQALDNYETLSENDITERLMERKISWWRLKGESLLSIILLILVITSLLLFTIDWDYIVFNLFSLREALLLLINLYYGYRD
jgi:hypothetical protein